MVDTVWGIAKVYNWNLEKFASDKPQSIERTTMQCCIFHDQFAGWQLYHYHAARLHGVRWTCDLCRSFSSRL